MKTLLTIAALALLLTVTGCADILTNLGDGRMEAWKEVRTAEETTSQKFLDTKKAEFESKKNVTQNPTLRLKSYDATGQLVGEAEMDLQPMFAELGLKKESDTYGVPLQKTEQPTGQIAETLGAAGDTVVKAASSPGGIIMSTAYGVSRGIKESGGGGTRLQADEMNIDSSFNQNKATSIGSGTASASQGTTQAAAAAEDVFSGSAYSAFDKCLEEHGGYASSLSTVAGCIEEKTGIDGDINGGIFYLDGEPFAPLNDWEAARP